MADAPVGRARSLGGRVVALTMPIFADNNQSFKTFCAIWLLPGWRPVLDQPSDRVIAELRDPAKRPAFWRRPAIRTCRSWRSSTGI